MVQYATIIRWIVLSGKLNEVLLDKLFMPDYALC